MNAKTAVLLSIFTGAFMALGYAVFDVPGMLEALAIASAYHLYAYVYGSQVIIRSLQAQQANPNNPNDDTLIETVHRLADAAAIPRPGVYVTEEEQPNALSIGRNPSHSVIVFSTGLLQALTENELAGVIAHELAHIKRRDCLTMAIAASISGATIGMAGAIALVGFFIRGRGGALGMILFGIGAAIAALMAQLAIGRGLEYEADEAGATICQHPEWLADALRKLAKAGEIENQAALMHPATASMFFVCPLPPTWLVRAFSTHPPIEERVARLERMQHN